MNRRDIAGSAIIDKVYCSNCGAVKYATTLRINGTTNGSMIAYLDKTSKCCDHPDYNWYPNAKGLR